MATMNLITMMNRAWDDRQSLSPDRLEEIVKNLLSHAHVNYDRVLRANGYPEDKAFYVFQDILVFIALSDGDFLQGEYDAYVKYCNWAGIQPLSVDDCRALYKRTTTDRVADDISLLKSYRYHIDEDKYTALVYACCLLSLLGDKQFDENEYYIIRCFFDSSVDYCPSTWEQFKIEW